ncbi:MAG TPA: Uma2 family endonuclease, partial [Urbifossiella sp.]
RTIHDGAGRNFFSRAAIAGKRVRLTGAKRGHRDTELVGMPDLIIEVVNNSSVDEDTEWLMSKYWDAGIPEYWVINARSTPLRFAIYRRTAKGYVAVRKQESWSKSTVLERSFRFVPGEKELGHATYEFEVRL